MSIVLWKNYSSLKSSNMFRLHMEVHPNSGTAADCLDFFDDLEINIKLQLAIATPGMLLNNRDMTWQ